MTFNFSVIPLFFSRKSEATYTFLLSSFSRKRFATLRPCCGGIASSQVLQRVSALSKRLTLFFCLASAPISSCRFASPVAAQPPRRGSSACRRLTVASAFLIISVLIVPLLPVSSLDFLPNRYKPGKLAFDHGM
jgi:hypothetical protein